METRDLGSVGMNLSAQLHCWRERTLFSSFSQCLQGQLEGDIRSPGKAGIFCSKRAFGSSWWHLVPILDRQWGKNTSAPDVLGFLTLFGVHQAQGLPLTLLWLVSGHNIWCWELLPSRLHAKQALNSCTFGSLLHWFLSQMKAYLQMNGVSECPSFQFDRSNLYFLRGGCVTHKHTYILSHSSQTFKQKAKKESSIFSPLEFEQIRSAIRSLLGKRSKQENWPIVFWAYLLHTPPFPDAFKPEWGYFGSAGEK